MFLKLVYFFRRYDIFFSFLITNMSQPIWVTFLLVVLDDLCQYHDVSTAVLPDHIEKIIHRFGLGCLCGNEFFSNGKTIDVISAIVR
uniref:AsIV-cont00020-ORF2 n=1 Tax=Apophua simplicipes ichnovirus TaxID=1329648 RepID=S5DMH5_9VIRU|nr:AsIV-cont00020-ORF2 [Apophua simplicipes ichnovirus]